MREVECGLHGKQGIGLVCIHIALAVDGEERVGFYVGAQGNTGRPDAWCAACEQKLVALKGAQCDQWALEAKFKVFCVLCWDDASRVCGTQSTGRTESVRPRALTEEWSRPEDTGSVDQRRGGVLSRILARLARQHRSDT